MNEIDNGYKATIAEIKNILPDVKVNVQGAEYVGRVTGRINKFASVTVNHPIWGQHTFEFSWQAIKRAVNNNEALLV